MTEYCIYCDSSNKFSKEHCIPLGLGKFLGHHILLKTVCRSCNEKIGKTEEQFLRASPEAFFRHYLGIKGRKYHQAISPYYRGSSGAPAIKIKYPLPGQNFDILWEILPNSSEIRQLRQIVMRLDNGDTIPVPLPEEINTKEKLIRHLKKSGIEKAEPVFFSVDPEEWEDMVELLKNAWPGKKASEISNNIRGIKIPTQIEFTMTSLYFRALAKIGFHYFLSVFCDQFTGAEPEFEPIRGFILNEIGNRKDFTKQVNQQMIFQFARGQVPNVWGHVLTAEKLDYSIISRVQFFVGPKIIPPVIQINIGPNPLRIFSSENHGHFYKYFNGSSQNGYDGEVETLTSARGSLFP